MITTSVDLLGLNPFWCGFSCCVFSRCNLRRCKMIFSKIFDCTSSCEIGLYDAGSVGGLFGFWSIIILAFFSALGKHPVLSVALYRSAIWIPIFFGMYFRISIKMLVGPVALLYILFRKVCASINLIGLVKILFLFNLLRSTVSWCWMLFVRSHM